MALGHCRMLSGGNARMACSIFCSEDWPTSQFENIDVSKEG
jgi:hypothetical protein